MALADIAACVELLREHDPGQDEADWVARLGRDITGADKHPVVAVADKAIVGYARTMPFTTDPGMPANAAPDGHYLLGLVVASAHRRRGIGRLLTQERLRWLLERGVDSAYYYTEHDNVASQFLHEQMGFCRMTDDFWFPGLPDGHAKVLYRFMAPSPHA